MKTNITFIVLLLIMLFLCGCMTSSKPVLVKLDIKTLRFDTVFVSESGEEEFTVINNSIKQFEVTDVQIVGDNASEFSIKSGWSGTITVQEKSELTIVIEFLPTSVGIKKAQVEISHNYESEKSPIVLDIEANSTIDTKLEANPNKYHFGFIPVGTSLETDIEFYNTGLKPLDITKISFQGNDANNYEVKTGWSGSPVHVSDGGMHVITVKFSPNSDGEKLARMQVEHTGSNSPIFVDFTGGGGYGYIMEKFTAGMTSIRNTGIEIITGNYDDDVWFNYNLGFIFNFFGKNYSTIWICDNGWASFGSDPNDAAYENYQLPCPGPPIAAVYPFWDDVEFNRYNVPDAKWIYQIDGSAPNRVFIVEWYKLNRYDTSPVMYCTYQLRLYETTNIIEFHYSTAPNDWVNSAWTATIGIEDEVVGKSYQVAGTPGIKQCPSYNYRFIP